MNPITCAYSRTLSFAFLPVIISYIKNIACPPSSAGIGKIFINARIIEIKAVLDQNPFQSHFEGNKLPIAPKPPNCDAPFFVNIYFNCAIYSYRVQYP